MAISGLKTEDGSGETLKKSLLSVNGSNGHVNGVFHDSAADLVLSIINSFTLVSLYV
jgi:hypothetical protein